MAQCGHIRNALAHQIAVYRRRGAEGSDSIAVNHRAQLLWLKIVKIIHHHCAAHQPLAVELAPGSLGPTGFRHSKVQSILLGLLPVLGGDNMSKGIGKIMNYAFGISGGSRGEV